MAFLDAETLEADSGLQFTDALRTVLAVYTGYFTDPEGNGWEIVWAPTWTLDDQGGLTLPN